VPAATVLFIIYACTSGKDMDLIATKYKGQ